MYIYTQDTLQVGRFITPESLEDARFRKSFFLTVLTWFLIRLEDMNLIRIEFGHMISIWFCYVLDMVWVMV